MEAPIAPPFANSHQLHETNVFPAGHPALISQPDLGLDTFNFDPQLASQPNLGLPNRHGYGDGGAFEGGSLPSARFQEVRSNAPAATLSQGGYNHGTFFDSSRRATRQRQGNHPATGQMFGILTPQPALPSHIGLQADELRSSRGELEPSSHRVQGDGSSTGTHFGNMKMEPNPPNLDAWRQRLFDVDGTIVMTEAEFQTYFPHVDNIYSHRSTQKYKRKPFVSHYWDCRLKGRPPGTAKSDDPSKKKRKRQARERDQCDVKIKITEYFPGARVTMSAEDNLQATEDGFDPSSGQVRQDLAGQRAPVSSVSSRARESEALPGADGARFYTIQRVNGNGTNGKVDNVISSHRHSMEESDRIKKNSIHRYFLKEEKERRKSIKTYHKKATGEALNTVKRHSRDHELKLYGSCFCPFVQRVWIALELKGLSYQYVEIDPYKKPPELLEINPRGLVPALRHGSWGCYESTVLMEYLEDLNTGSPLLPPNNPQLRAHCRLWSDHINRKILPHFYGTLQAQEQDKQISEAAALKDEIAKLVEVADPSGPFFLGPHMSFVDIQFAPWIVRLRRVLTPYRGWTDPQPGSRWAAWVDAIENNEGVRATTSSDDLYIDSYERYAENRPNTSQVAAAINEGRGLP